MGMIVIWNKMTRAEAEGTLLGVEAWFKAHPRKRICKVGCGETTLFSVHRGHVREEIEEHTEKEDKLPVL